MCNQESQCQCSCHFNASIYCLECTPMRTLAKLLDDFSSYRNSANQTLDVQNKEISMLIERIDKIERSFKKDEGAVYDLNAMAGIFRDIDERLSKLESPQEAPEKEVNYISFSEAMVALTEGKKVRCDDVWTNKGAYIYSEKNSEPAVTNVFLNGNCGVFPYQLNTVEIESKKWRILEDV